MPKYMHNIQSMIDQCINISRHNQFIPDLPQNLLHCRDDSRDELRPGKRNFE